MTDKLRDFAVSMGVEPNGENIKELCSWGFAVIKKNEKWAVLSQNGEFLLTDFDFDYIGYDASTDTIYMQAPKASTIVTHVDGKMNSISTEYYRIHSYKNIFLEVEDKDGKIGFLDMDGNLIQEPEFDSFWYLDNGHVIANKNSLWGIYSIDEKKWILEPKYVSISGFSDAEVALAEKPDGKFNFIHSNGELLLEDEFDYADTFSTFQYTCVGKFFKKGILGRKKFYYAYLDLNGDFATDFCFLLPRKYTGEGTKNCTDSGIYCLVNEYIAAFEKTK